ncbi:MAG TPA: hypothetical protein VFG85_00805 [Gaiellaceae bacterium]|nr:hypothetical protein [Gaiellaceae bacterium]
MHRVLDRLPMLPFTLRAALALFVVAWIFGVHDLRSTIPVWVAFVIALGLEINFFLGALTRPPAPRPDRGPQPIDRERYGYLAWPEDEGDEEYEDDELWEDESRWPAVRRFLWGVGIIAALALTFWLVDRNTGWDSLSTETRAEAQERFSAEASRIAEKDVRIRCDESGEYVGAVQHADGVAQVGGELAYLTPERCLDLYRLAFEDEVTGSQTGRAVSVLAHEAWHLRGEGNEGTTECYAIQSGVELGRRLGLSEDEAHRLMAQQLAENSGRGIATAEYRVPPECRDGGGLDLDPGSSRFP